MAVHYSEPGGFVGRNICYAIMHEGVYYGAIVGGSATLHLVGRDEFFKIDKAVKKATLRCIVKISFSTSKDVAHATRFGTWWEKSCACSVSA